MINKEIGKEGGTITYGYSLNCNDPNLVVKATVPDKDSGWVTVTGNNMSQSGTLEIVVDPNQGSSRGTTIEVNIVDTSTSTIASTCTQKYISISQEGEGGGGGGCSYKITGVNPLHPSCGESFTITWTKTEQPSPGPTECDDSIKIYYGEQEGRATVDCSKNQMQLRAETTVQCDITGIWKEDNSYNAAGSSGRLVPIATIVSGCDGGNWTFIGDGSIVEPTSICVRNVNEVHGIVKANSTGSKHHEDVRGICSNGCEDEFEIWQNGGDPPPPEPTNYKWFATYTGGNTASAACDPSNATIKRGDVSLENLISVKIGGCVDKINEEAFSGCTTLTSVTINDGVTTIGDNVFNRCTNLKNITIPNSVTTIGRNVFVGCNNLPNTNNIKYADTYAVKATKDLSTYQFKEDTRFIGSSAFEQRTNLTNITIPNGVILISNEAFNGCSSLTSVTIPNGVTRIDASAFRSCTSLGSITIPESVVYIGHNAFYDCTGLESITCLATTPPTLDGTGVFGNSTCPILVPSQSVTAYKSASGWSSFASRIQAI